MKTTRSVLSLRAAALLLGVLAVLFWVLVFHASSRVNELESDQAFYSGDYSMGLYSTKSCSSQRAVCDGIEHYINDGQSAQHERGDRNTFGAIATVLTIAAILVCAGSVVITRRAHAAVDRTTKA